MRMIEKVKKGLSVLLCLVMLVQYMPVTARAAETSDTVTVYFQNNWLWSEVSLYYWGSGGTNPEWPGYSMAFVENDGTYDVYKFEVPTDVTSFVINGIKDDGSGNRDQTPDITGGWYDGICYYMQWADGNQVGSYASYCEHSSHDTEGICGSCTANVGHSYDSTGFCSCGLECSHSSETNGVCDTCGKTVSHTHNYVNGACSCGAAAQVLVTYNDSTTKYFETLQDALDTLSANNSDVTVKLLTNISVGDKVSADIYTHYTLDLNGYCLTANELVVPASGGMEIMDGSGGRTGQVNALVRAHGPLIIWGGTFNNTVLITTMSNVKGSVIVREGTFTAAADFQIADDACSLSLWDCAFPGGIKVEAVADASASKADLAAFPYYGRSYFLNCEEAVLTQGQSEISGDMVRVAYQVSHQFGTSNKCAACGLDAIVSMTLDGVTTYYGTVYDLRQDLVQENAGCTIQLLTDITTTYFGDKDGRCGFYLDLNGHTLTASDGVSLPGSSGCTIMDTSAEKNGKIVGEVYAAYSTALTGGTIEGTVSFPKKASSTGYTFQMEGGTIDADMDFGINDNNTIIKLTGGSFPGGISIACGDNVITPKTLADCISGNYRYFQNGSVVTLTEGQTQITGGDVTVAVHAGHTHSYVNGFCELVEGETHYEPAILNDNGWYEIGNAGQLYWFAQQVDNGTGATYNVVLTADITDNPGTVTAESTGLRQWNPIGNDWNSCYNGIFDGNHKTISGLYFESTAKENNGAGLFTCIGYNATVKNVSLTNSHLHSYRYAGGIVGWNRGIIIDCVNHATISASAGHVGGVTGSNEGIIERCGNTGSVTSTNSEQNDDNAQYAGGVVGSQGQMKPGATLRNCWNTGSVNGTVCVGGVVGALTSAVVTIENCWSTGNVTGTESTTVGGVAGQVTNGKIINCYAPQATAVGEQAATATVTNVESKTLEQFASGEVTYLFQTRSANNLWGQDLDNGKTAQLHPAFDGALVYQIAANCAGAPGYSNTNENKGTHNYSENGFCINPDVNGNPCDDYQPAEQLTAERCAELGLDATVYNGYYAISNAGNLYWFAQQVDNNVGNNYNVVLTDNITVNSGTVTAESTGLRAWNPIGYWISDSDMADFNGIFDGSGKTVSGLYYSSETENIVGLIARAGSDSVVKNVTLSNSYLRGFNTVGGIVAWGDGVVTGCINNATISSKDNIAGGIVATNRGTVELCGNTGSVSSDNWSAGGIVGYSLSIIRNCWNTGKITAKNYYAGGIVAYFQRQENSVVENCWSTGEVTVQLHTNLAGGIVAFKENGPRVYNCYTTSEYVQATIQGDNLGLCLAKKDETQFASGEVAYLLRTNAADGTNVWGQDLDNGKTAQLHPTFDGALVYQIAANCAGAPGYSNTNENKGTHNYSENGFCVNTDANGDPCDDYQPAEKLTAERCAELGLDAACDGWYAIGNAGQLYWFSQMVDTEYTTYNNANVVLIDDITVNEGAVTKDSTGIRVWNPIGSSSGKEDFSHAYNGTFDGNGHSISGLYYHEANTYGVGLIAAAGESAVVKDVTLSNSWFFGYINVGGIVALNKGAISGCVNAADMDIYWQNLGGIVGTNYGAITGCSNSGTIGGWITNTGIQNAVAGIAGGSYGTVEQCENAGNITSRHNSAGGIVGVAAFGAEVSKCRNTGDIKSTIWAGGIVAHNAGTVTLCVSEAAVTSGNHVGGIVGLNLNGSRAYVKNCWSTGTVTGTDNGACVGGIVGTNATANGCLNCWSTAAVTGTGAKAGGIVGYATTENSTKNGYTTHEKPVGESFLYADVDWDTLLTKTEEQFASGEVAYLLQKDQTEQVWGQNLDNGQTPQSVPTFDGAVVYQIITDCAGKVGYSNTNSPAPDHVYVNGFCDQVAGQTHYEPAVLNADGVYEISNAGQLYWFADKVDTEYDTFKAANAILMGNITINSGDVNAESTGMRQWNPIGFAGGVEDFSGAFAGIFDGNGKTISGLYFQDESAETGRYVGLFAATGTGAVVKNVTLSNSYIKAHAVTGGIVGINHGTITGCVNNSDIDAVGGFKNSIGTIGGCILGGIAGFNLGTVTFCINNGNIEGTDTAVGGIIGHDYNTASRVEYCGNTGKIKALNVVGGVFGNCGASTILNCWSTGDVKNTNGDWKVGTLGGHCAYATVVRNCYSLDFSGNPIGANYGNAANQQYVEKKTIAQFESGEVAYLLQSRLVTQEDPIPQIWGQDLDNGKTKQTHPTFDGAVVYQIITDCAGKVGYSNTNSPAPDHVYVNGFCDQVAGQTHYEPAEKLTAERCAELGLDAAYAGYYAIGNGGQLYWFSQLVDEGGVNANAVLLNDIVVNQKVVNADGTLVSDASSLRVWKPIGKRLAHYRGVFDGNGKTVSGLYFNNSADASVDAPNENIGLIGVLAYGAVVKNVTVSDSYLYGNYSVGSVAGYNFGTVSGCRNNSTVGASNYVGGVVGYNNNGIVELCANTGKIKAYDSNAGGIVGYCTGIVRNSWNTGEIDAVEACAGGIAGSLIGGNARVENCWTNDAVIYENGGGIAGLTDGTVTIRNCYTMHATAVGEARATAVITDVLTKTVEQFASGEVAYLLRTRVAEGVENVWGQNIDNGGTNEGVPVFSDAKVYQVDVNCVGDKGYSNTDASKVVHNYDDNGFCINPAANGDLCDAYEPAVEVKADNWESLGLTESYIGYYAISNAGQLYWFADKVDNENDVYRSANVVLTDNITVNEGTVTAESSGLRHWNPIGGDYDTGFNGTFDGNHKTISGLYFNDEKAGCVGLISFGWYESTVCNVTLSNSYLYGNVAVGGIIGYNRGRVTGCVNHATIHAADMSAGGIVGLSEGPIELCGNTGSISNSSNGNGSIGGIVGEYAYSVYAPEDDHLVNCWNTGDVTGTKLAGGIAGQFASGDIWPAVPMENCWSTGNVTGTESATTGGVVGLVSNARIVNCYAPQTNPVGELATSATAINVESKTIQQFASGEVAYLLQTRAAEGTNVWGQNLDNGQTVQTVPTFDGAAVYQIVANCAGDTGYSNTNENKGTHNYSENGFCINPDVNGDPCDDYQPAERLTAARCTELGLDVAYADYYAIKNAGNLYWFAEQVDNDNANFGTANVVLTDNITINSGSVNAESTGLRQWNPIGCYARVGIDDYDERYFSGIFDGNGKTISGLYYYNTDSVSGFFNQAALIAATGSTALVKDVTLSNSWLSATMSVSGIVGHNGGRITGCINQATIIADQGAGGVVYANVGIVELCGNTGTVMVSETDAGGIACSNSTAGRIRNCWNTGEISGAERVGGIAGQMADWGNPYTIVENCWSTDAITGEANISGIVGAALGTTKIRNCYTTMAVTHTVISNAGILVENVETKTEDQFASGEVAYLLRTRAAEGTNAWGQDLDNGKTVQTVPTFDGAAVYRGYASCTDTAAKYTNDSTISPDPIPHDWKYTANGAQITGQCGYNCGTDSGKVTLTAPANTVYEGVEKTVTVAGALTDVTTLPQVTYEGDRVNVGTFTAKLTVGDATAQLPVQIVPYELEIQTFVPETKVYDGTTTCGVKSLSFVSTANGEELVLGTDFSAVLTFPGTDAGEYTDVVLTVQLLDTPLASNYKLKNGTITGATHTITPAAITVTDVKVEDKVYDGTTDATVTGVTISGVLAGETVSVKAEGVFADKNSGENKTVNLTYTLSGEDAGNYVLAEETGTTTAKITVKPLPEIMEPVKDLTVDNVTSEDKDALEDVKEELEHVLTDEGLSDEERKEREDALKDVQDMLDRIQEAADAIKTDPIIDTKHITAENVVPEDREDIENALEDLYGALENYENNYTEKEKEGIHDDIERLEAALAALKAVEDVIKEIEELPDGVEPDTELRDDILDTKGKYDELPERLKDMIPQELVDKLNKLLADLKVYLIIKGDGQTWSDGELGFTANGPCDRFVQLLIDGNVVDASNYTVVSGSTVLTIKESYAKTLTGGKHSISFVYPDGQAVGSFTVVIPTNGSATTGDDANIVFWTGAMVVSLAALAVLLAESRKRRYAK